MSETPHKDLTVSQVDRQNILNNSFALKEVEKATQIDEIPFEGKRVVTKEQVATFFDVTPRTIDNYLERHGEELRQNGGMVPRWVTVSPVACDRKTGRFHYSSRHPVAGDGTNTAWRLLPANTST